MRCDIFFVINIYIDNFNGLVMPFWAISHVYCARDLKSDVKSESGQKGA